MRPGRLLRALRRKTERKRELRPQSSSSLWSVGHTGSLVHSNTVEVHSSRAWQRQRMHKDIFGIQLRLMLSQRGLSKPHKPLHGAHGRTLLCRTNGRRTHSLGWLVGWLVLPTLSSYFSEGL